MTDEKIMCSQCGSPAILKRNPGGKSVLVSVMKDILDDYFSSREDIEEFTQDRLRRAERIIVELRNQLKLEK